MLIFSFSDIRDGAIVCLLANLMEQLILDQSADIFHQARRIAFSSPVFQSEVKSKLFIEIEIFFFLSIFI